jgi:hypothetical protein
VAEVLEIDRQSRQVAREVIAHAEASRWGEETSRIAKTEAAARAYR